MFYIIYHMGMLASWKVCQHLTPSLRISNSPEESLQYTATMSTLRYVIRALQSDSTCAGDQAQRESCTVQKYKSKRATVKKYCKPNGHGSEVHKAYCYHSRGHNTVRIQNPVLILNMALVSLVLMVAHVVLLACGVARSQARALAQHFALSSHEVGEDQEVYSTITHPPKTSSQAICATAHVIATTINTRFSFLPRK